MRNQKKKKIEKTHAKEKQSHTQDNIYVNRQFTYAYEQRKTITHTRQYLRESTIYLRLQNCRDFTIIGKKYKVWLQCFTLSLKTTTTQ